MNIVKHIGFGTLLLTSITYANISGIVYQDLPVNGTILNTYGVKDANELGIGGVTITGYPSGETNTTMSDGSWSLATTGDVRVEFSNWPSYLKVSPDTGSNSSVQFISNGATANLGLYNPSAFINTNPSLATTHFVNGKENPDIGDLPTLFSWPYSNRGTVNPNQQTLADTSVARSLWGLAYSSSRKKLYSATILRRHSSIGSEGLGAIYATDFETDTTSYFKSIPDVGAISSDVFRGLNDADEANTDTEAFAKVAKVGLGDIEISEDESTLYAINLFNKKIYEINLDTENITKSYAAPSATCTNGESRPFALTHHEGNLYVGSVCDASTANCDTSTHGQCTELTAHVHKIPTGSTNGSEIFSMRLDYDKEQTVNLPTYTGDKKNWNPWTDTYTDVNKNFRMIHPVPILSNIKFHTTGDMILGFADRTALQGGALTNDINGDLRETFTFSGGDILKATLNSDGSFSIDNYNFIDDNTTDTEYREGALGAVAHIMGSNQTVFTQYDNVSPNADYTKGVTFISNTNGSNVGAYRVADDNRPRFFGKSMGIGDIELITASAPTEIGNRVWSDTNSDGIQDANESALDGVEVKLFKSGVEIATATTDASGNYIFSNDSSKVSTASHKYNLTSLVPNADYSIIIPNVQGTNKQNRLNTLMLTNPNNNVGVGSNINDSDAIIDEDNATISIAESDIPYAGSNNHSFDIGFKTIPTYTLGDYVWIDSNYNGVQDNNESGVNGITVNLYTTTDCTGNMNTTTTTMNGGTPAKDGFYKFTNLLTGDYCIEFTNLPANHTISPTTGANDTSNSDANNSAHIGGINLTANNMDEDMGIYPTIIVGTPTVNIGNRVWIESDNDGDATTGVVTPLTGITVTARASDGTTYSSVTDNNGTYLITVPQNDTYIVTISTPSGYTPTANSDDNNISDTTTEENLSHNGNGTTVTVGTVDNLSVDFGFRIIPNTTPPSPTPSTPPTTPSTPTTPNTPILEEGEAGKVCFGDKVWDDLNRDGIQDSNEVGIEDVKVTLYASDCLTELNTTRTDNLGNYLFSNLEIGEYCVGFSEFSSDYTEYLATFKNQGQDDTKDSDVNRDTNKTDSFTLDAIENEECNISIDMGIFKRPTCSEVIIHDDISNANENNPSTQIDVLNNDIGITNEQIIKLLPISEGELLWTEESAIPNSIELQDTLMVEGEGVWSVQDGAIIFTAYDEFNGEIPSPIYYTVVSPNCNAIHANETILSNIAQVKINTPCYCDTYNKSSVPALNTLGLITIMFLNSILILFFFRKETDQL
ncbi:MAG: hypothetical protein K0U38_08010 [Epsilonproteobacteria bacterium]|nr:hypothetical protein [Campylobacterota bacterium]